MINIKKMMIAMDEAFRAFLIRPSGVTGECGAWIHFLSPPLISGHELSGLKHYTFIIS